MNNMTGCFHLPDSLDICYSSSSTCRILLAIDLCRQRQRLACMQILGTSLVLNVTLGVPPPSRPYRIARERGCLPLKTPSLLCEDVPNILVCLLSLWLSFPVLPKHILQEVVFVEVGDSGDLSLLCTVSLFAMRSHAQLSCEGLESVLKS